MCSTYSASMLSALNTALYETDPGFIGCVENDLPDEYLSEAKLILETPESSENLGGVIKSVLNTMFGDIFDNDDESNAIIECIVQKYKTNLKTEGTL